MRAKLALEDGTIFEGIAFGAKGERAGEVVFNTGMTGYQEILTDPSYCGQIVTMTYPLIGNYGINDDDFESRRPFVRGFVVREFCQEPSNWRARRTIAEYLEENGIVGIAGIDTRALTRRIRIHGAMRGIITTEDLSPQELMEKVQAVPDISSQDLVVEVTIKESYRLEGGRFRVVLMDFGAKLNIARELHRRGCDVTVVPAHTRAEEILAMDPDGIMLSNGPGDPQQVPYAVETVRRLIGKKPIFGICLGHQIIGIALGAATYKLKFGHRGSNHPVKDYLTGKVYITSQNHGFVVDDRTLPDDVIVTHRNLNDGSVEGLMHRELPLFSVQYHPEAAPGPWDSAYLFDRFIEMMEREGGGR
ncbi:MAG: carbamoyl-phosphate synthase small subunit [Eubacteriales bacterium]|nr:carbamoyl-phosphate synthase small subunit [Eubacteriales bacterium]